MAHARRRRCPPRATTVTGVVDWERRHQLMRTHTAMHVLCGVIWNEWGKAVTGGNMEPLAARMDFEFDPLPEGFATRVEDLVNEEIAADRPIEIDFLPRDTALEDADLIRTKVNLIPESVAEIRVVDIVGLDKQADGGTHVRSHRRDRPLRGREDREQGQGQQAPPHPRPRPVEVLATTHDRCGRRWSPKPLVTLGRVPPSCVTSSSSPGSRNGRRCGHGSGSSRCTVDSSRAPRRSRRAAAEAAGASLYAVVQPEDLKWHVPSLQYDPAHSASSRRSSSTSTSSVSVHGYGGLRGSDDRWITALVGGGNRALAGDAARQLLRDGAAAVPVRRRPRSHAAGAARRASREPRQPAPVRRRADRAAAPYPARAGCSPS